MHVSERITFTDADTITDTIEVDAPKVLTGPWKASRTFLRHRERKYDLVESSCRQGDFFEDTDRHGNAVFSSIPKDAGGAPLPPDQATLPPAAPTRGQ